MADGTKFQTLSPLQLSVAVGFMMSLLPEDKLAELDAMLDNDEAQVAADAALKPEKARAWAAMNSHTRHAVRQARSHTAQQASAAQGKALEMFPDMARIKTAF